jgi:hypothetical protein
MRAFKARGRLLKNGQVRLKVEEPVEPGPVEAVVWLVKPERRRSRIEVKAVSWDTIREMSGCVSLGGDALKDCEALYDGA